MQHMEEEEQHHEVRDERDDQPRQRPEQDNDERHELERQIEEPVIHEQEGAFSDFDSDNNLNDAVPEQENYSEIFKHLKSRWILTEIHHSVSKSASEAFWKIALMNFHKLQSSLNKKKTPQFKSIRRQMHKDLVPEIELEIAYKEKSSGEVIIIMDTVTPLKRFSPAKFEKLYEIGTVKVNK